MSRSVVSAGLTEGRIEWYPPTKEELKCRMVLAKTAAGDLAVAYLPNNKAIEIDVSTFPALLRARWFDPVHGAYTATPGHIENKGTSRLSPPAKDATSGLLSIVNERETAMTAKCLAQQLDWYGSYLDRATFQWSPFASRRLGS